MICLKRNPSAALCGPALAVCLALAVGGCDGAERPAANGGDSDATTAPSPPDADPTEANGDADAENANSASKSRQDDELWPSGDESDQIRELAEHIGGFSVAMREVGYRYNEMYFAGIEENWRLADYHLSKLVAAIEQGETRRPRRSEDAEAFLDYAVPPMIEAIESRDVDRFVDEFTFFAERCNDCHIDQRVPFIEITLPQQRLLPWATPGYEAE